jgi:hypothetical protein
MVGVKNDYKLPAGLFYRIIYVSCLEPCVFFPRNIIYPQALCQLPDMRSVAVVKQVYLFFL